MYIFLIEGTTFWTYWELLGFKSNDFTLKILFLWIFDEGNLKIGTKNEFFLKRRELKKKIKASEFD